VVGPYGFLDRQPGWIFTLSESSQGRDMMYTSYNYSVDQWEIDYKLSSACPGWKKIEEYEKNLKEKQKVHASLITSKEAYLDDKIKKKGDDSLLGNLLQMHATVDKKKKRAPSFF